MTPGTLARVLDPVTGYTSNDPYVSKVSVRLKAGDLVVVLAKDRGQFLVIVSRDGEIAFGWVTGSYLRPVQGTEASP